MPPSPTTIASYVITACPISSCPLCHLELARRIHHGQVGMLSVSPPRAPSSTLAPTPSGGEERDGSTAQRGLDLRRPVARRLPEHCWAPGRAHAVPGPAGAGRGAVHARVHRDAELRAGAGGPDDRVGPAQPPARRLPRRRALGLRDDAGGRVHPARLPDPGNRQDARLSRTVAGRLPKRNPARRLPALPPPPAARLRAGRRLPAVAARAPGAAGAGGRGLLRPRRELQLGRGPAVGQTRAPPPDQLRRGAGDRLPAPARPAQAVLPVPLVPPATPAVRPAGVGVRAVRGS